MKKVKFLLPLALLLMSSVVACSNENVNLKFESNEYVIQNGDKVTIEESSKGVTYEIVNNPYENVITIDSKTGKISFNDTIPNYTQIMVIAKYKNEVSSPCIVTLSYEYQASEVNFTNMSSYIVNNEYINAVSSKNYSVTYELKDKIEGISIENQTGKITYAPIMKNNTLFTVVANSHGSKTEKSFYAMTEGFVTTNSARQVLERGDLDTPAIYPLDFSNSDIAENDEVIAVVTTLNEPISTDYYSYNKDNNELTISATYANSLNDGENTLKVITERNSIEIRLDVATKFITTAEELAAINNSEEALSGYYLLMNDIDLSSYLAKGGKGYNDGKGWTPIGLYTDTLDATIATQYSFKGTFDGNGHVITNMYANRKDNASFNAGLFGYITSSATIKNLGVQGSLTVSSYSGGLVGSNSGIIENCFADVDMNVSSGEGAYRYVGGFVGNNFGTIKNSYSLGTVLCDRDYGSFVGSNEGSIENCFAYKTENCPNFLGYGYNGTKCIQFDDETSMINHNWSEVLPNDSWAFNDNSLPSLKPSLEEFNLRGIVLNLEIDKVFKGDNIPLDAKVLPSKFEDEYKDDIEYEIIGEGYFILGNHINTTNAVDPYVTVKATLTVDGKTYSDEKIIYLSSKIESLTIEHNLTYLEAGKRYLLEATCIPSDALDPITYHLSSRYMGASIEDNILIIDNEFNLDTISFYAISESGVKSNTVTINVKKQLIVESGVAVTYLNEDKDLEFTFSSEIDLTNVKVKVYGKEVDYQLTNNTISISKSLLENTKDSKVRFIFELNDGTVYGSDAYYFSHERYDENSINGDDVIKIYTVEDFFKYFNTDTTATYDSNKIQNYDKTFLLMNDLDFGGKELYAIGYSDAEFSGIFYGNGHTLSNFTIKKNEKFCVESSSSCYYGVGLFSVVSGSIYDLTIKDATIDGKNFTGGIVGMLTTGHIENCYGTNLKVTASEYQFSSEDIIVGKLVGKKYSGSTICLYYDNLSLNTVG